MLHASWILTLWTGTGIKKMLKKILLLPFSFLESAVDRIISAAGALVFMQVPSFMVQYQQRLGGHVDELKRLVGKYSAAAADNGRTLEEYISLHLQSGVKEFAATGNIMTGNVERFNMLSEALKKISDSAGIKKFFVFIQNLDWEIFRNTLRDFVPAVSLNTDSILYGICGIILFMLLYFLIKKIVAVFANRFIFKKSKGSAAR